MVKHRLYIAGVALIISLCSCNQDIIVDHTWELSQGNWDHSHVLEDQWTLADTQQYYRLSLDVYHHAEFDYQNLYLQLQLRGPQAKVLEETTSIQLMNPRTTQWIGERERDEIIHLKTVLQDSLLLNNTGQYHINISQYSRDSLLRGIIKIGFQLEALQ